MNLTKLLPEPVYFVTGIDTDAGKTFATAWLSKQLLQEGTSVVTQKLIQTGCDGISEDITMHRQIEGRALLPEDRDGTTCPIIYRYPASPHMAAELESKHPELNLARKSTQILLKKHQKVLIEGAGGVMVPLHRDYLTLDYVVEEALPLILVTTARLGSINQTLLNLSLFQSKAINLAAVVYNQAISTDAPITADTEAYLRQYVATHFPSTHFLTLPLLTPSTTL